MEDYIPYGLHWIDEEDINAVVEVLKSNWIATGPKIKEFEEKFAKYIGCKYAVAVNSGTSALDIAIASLDIEKDSEVITTPFTFVATSNAIIFNGLKPIFADIKPDTYNINPEEIENKITEKTKAIIYVDYAGQPCDIDKIRKMAEEHNLYLIEDAAHALGAEYKGGKVGCFADLTAFSFYPVKHIATGEGGMVTTNNEELYRKLLMLRNHGIDKPTSERFGLSTSYIYDMKLLSRNYRITDFQCALGISQLKKIEEFLKLREKVASVYNREFKNEDVIIPFVKPDVRHVWHLYTLLVPENINRDNFFNLIKSKYIGVNVHYIPIYRHTYYKKNYGINPKDFPVTEKIFKKIITIALFPRMTDDDLKRVVLEIKNGLRK